MTLRLTRLEKMLPLADGDGSPSIQFLRLYNGAMVALEAAFNGLEDAVSAIAAAQAAADAANTAADNANAAAESVTSEQSLVTSFIVSGSFTPPLITADTLGNVTIATHDRQYGDTALNPTRTVDGDTIATGEVSPSVVRFYYDDPDREGGAVAYLFTVDPDPEPVQGGDTHSVGAVEIPAAGTNDGDYVRPPGFTPSLL